MVIAQKLHTCLKLHCLRRLPHERLSIYSGLQYTAPLPQLLHRSITTDTDGDVHPVKKKKTAKKKESCFITDQALAADIVSEINVDLRHPHSTVLELSPGYGVLTQALLEAGAPKVVAFEPEINYHQHLEALMADLNDGRLKYFCQDLLRLPRFHVFDTVDSGAESEYFPEDNDGLPVYRCIQKQTAWEEEPIIRVVGVTASNRQKEHVYFRNLQYVLSAQESIFAMGRPEFFYFVSADEYDLMSMPLPPTNLTKYRPPVVFYKLLFDIELLDKVPRTCFTPRLQVRNKKRADASNDPAYLYFIRMTPKRSLYTDVCSKGNFPAFMFFIQQLLYKRKWRLIPRFELWAPGFGLELIKMGFTMMQYTGEVTPEDWVRLFKEFQDTPHFRESSFRTAFEEYTRGHVDLTSKQDH